MPSNLNLTLRQVKPEDVDLIFSWQQDKVIRQYSFNLNSPTYEEHKKWFSIKINNLNDKFYIITYGQIDCGTIRFDYNAEEDAYILSWYVDPQFHNMGIGKCALMLALNEFSRSKVIAKVKPANLASIKCLLNAGFKKISDDHYEVNRVIGDFK